MVHQSSVLHVSEYIFFILPNLSFDDGKTRADPLKQDRFAAARKLLELLNKQCLKCLRACNYLCIDETLYPTRNQISFKQLIQAIQQNMDCCSNQSTLGDTPKHLYQHRAQGNHRMTVANFIIQVQRMLQSTSLNAWMANKNYKGTIYLPTDCTHRLRLRHGFWTKSMRPTLAHWW